MMAQQCFFELFKSKSKFMVSRDEAINFNADIAKTDQFKFFKYKANLSENAEAGGADAILKNVTIAAPLKYLRDHLKYI